ncbi:unnamed protein product [Linum tenue]|uniref:Uncharacterized protein n=1 Tax=Linum tenue TaxID=586396 RepID=A0AAV0HI30_9ROSI|nr:unnamed protein product [Linum tenue]
MPILGSSMPPSPSNASSFISKSIFLNPCYKPSRKHRPTGAPDRRFNFPRHCHCRSLFLLIVLLVGKARRDMAQKKLNSDPNVLRSYQITRRRCTHLWFRRYDHSRCWNTNSAAFSSPIPRSSLLKLPSPPSVVGCLLVDRDLARNFLVCFLFRD